MMPFHNKKFSWTLFDYPKFWNWDFVEWGKFSIKKPRFEIVQILNLKVYKNKPFFFFFLIGK